MFMPVMIKIIRNFRITTVSKVKGKKEEWQPGGGLTANRGDER